MVTFAKSACRRLGACLLSSWGFRGISVALHYLQTTFMPGIACFHKSDKTSQCWHPTTCKYFTLISRLGREVVHELVSMLTYTCICICTREACKSKEKADLSINEKCTLRAGGRRNADPYLEFAMDNYTSRLGSRQEPERASLVPLRAAHHLLLPCASRYRDFAASRKGRRGCPWVDWSRILNTGDL